MKSRSIYTGRVIELNLEQVTLPNGHNFELEVVSHPGGAAVVALNNQGQVCLLHQYRHVTGGWLWELPAGKLAGGTPLDNAQRELAEESGVSAKDWAPLGIYWSSPGIFKEVVHLFLARQLTQDVATPEPDEVIRVSWVPLDEACQWAIDGKIVDGKTVVGLWRAQAAVARQVT